MPDQKVDTAADLEAAKKNLADAEAAHADALAAAEADKPPEAIVTDLLDAIVMRLGNRPEMRAMVTALHKQTERAPCPLCLNVNDPAGMPAIEIPPAEPAPTK